VIPKESGGVDENKKQSTGLSNCHSALESLPLRGLSSRRRGAGAESTPLPPQNPGGTGETRVEKPTPTLVIPDGELLVARPCRAGISNYSQCGCSDR